MALDITKIRQIADWLSYFQNNVTESDIMRWAGPYGVPVGHRMGRLNQQERVLVSRKVRTKTETNQWLIALYNWYSLILSLVLGSYRIRQGLVCSVPGSCDWVRYQVMVLPSWYSIETALWSRHECTLSQVGTTSKSENSFLHNVILLKPIMTTFTCMCIIPYH